MTKLMDSNKIAIVIQQQNFDLNQQYQALVANNQQDGACVHFIGRVRGQVQLYLEHYPKMTERSLNALCDQALERWELGRIRLLHRVGKIGPGEHIVFVGVSSPHRQEAFQAANFLMDGLKSTAPFWKKEISGEGELWVEAKHKDKEAWLSWA